MTANLAQEVSDRQAAITGEAASRAADHALIVSDIAELKGRHMTHVADVVNPGAFSILAGDMAHAMEEVHMVFLNGLVLVEGVDFVITMAGDAVAEIALQFQGQSGDSVMVKGMKVFAPQAS